MNIEMIKIWFLFLGVYFFGVVWNANDLWYIVGLVGLNIEKNCLEKGDLLWVWRRNFCGGRGIRIEFERMGRVVVDGDE